MRQFFLLLMAAALVVSAGCTTTRTLRMKIGSEPNGSHVAFQMNRKETGAADWIYLGTTPVDTVRRVDLDELKAAPSVKLKVMRSGYKDRVKEWTGAGFWREYKEKDGVFWAPRLVPSDR